MYGEVVNSDKGIVFTLATMPAATAVPSGTVVVVSDWRNTEWVSDGTYWLPRGGEQCIYAPDTKAYIGPIGVEAVFTLTIPSKFLSPNMEIGETHKSVKVGVSGTNTQALKLGGSGGTLVGYTIAFTAIASRSVASVGAGSLSGGNLVFTGSLPGTTTADVGTNTNAFATHTHAIASDLVLYLSANLASALDTLQTRNIRVTIRG